MRTNRTKEEFISAMKKYAVQCYETGTIIDVFNTREEAVEALREYEESDMNEGIYEAGFYEIKEMEE